MVEVSVGCYDMMCGKWYIGEWGGHLLKGIFRNIIGRAHIELITDTSNLGDSSFASGKLFYPRSDIFACESS